jgi:hypothetical protein
MAWKEESGKTGIELPVDCLYLGFTSSMDCLVGLLEYRLDLLAAHTDVKTLIPVTKTISLIAFGMLSVYGVLRLRDRIDSYFGGIVTLKKKKYLFDELQKLFGVVVMGELV